MPNHHESPGAAQPVRMARLILFVWAFSSLLKFVASAGQATRKAAKKRNVWGNHEHFDRLSNAASPSAAEFQQTVNAPLRSAIMKPEIDATKFGSITIDGTD